ncbi:MAG: hypothetical protein EA341_08050 [Mongoliibacter sp.]|uniref:DUF922 domain-containing protein n=1 Tax=Mongoliibacter sp. TaxID=2022438 RepID=UPI0012F27881|nr:hypothetical protein [Mongoliibacter sp.]TVP50181.1 MAG: hypothetical protein EA341_08050 [Mongoliibacter sp.]
MRQILLCIIFCTFGFTGKAFPQEVSFTVSKKTETIHNAIFEIVEIQDERKGGESIGDIFTQSTVLSKVRLGKDISQTLKNYFSTSVMSQAGSRQSILVKIEQFEIKESKNTSTVASGELKMKLGYYVKGSFDPIHLMDYEGGMNYRRSINRLDLAERVVQQALDNSLEYFNQWINSQALSNRALAGSVKLVIEDRAFKSDKDTVFYDTRRPLVWSDFTDRPRLGSTYNAMIFTSLAMEGKPFVEDGSIIMPLTIKVYMLPGQSWVRDRNSYSLNHEQRHFDVVRVVADRLIARLRTMDVNPENYEALVNDAYFDAYREMNKLQELYDRQTNHGRKKDIQERWNQLLDAALDGDYKNLEKVLNG